MLSNYGIFYYFKRSPHSLLICFSDDEVTYSTKIGKVTASYNGVDLVSYEIDGIDKLMKIHADGLIVLPNNALIDVINSVLRKETFEPLAYKPRSDFYVAKIIEIDTQIKVTSLLGERSFPLIKGLAVGDNVIINKENAFTCTGEYRKESRICSYNDLGINVSNEIMKVNELDIEKDLFEMEEK